MVVITPDPCDGSARAAELARWEARLRAQQAELEAFAASLTGQNRVEPLRALPSEPVTLALQMLNRDMGGESDLATFAGRLGLSPALAADLASGRFFALDIDRISQVCEALRCSPYDLWGPGLAQRILHAYGPERWPSHIEPLADGRELPSSLDEFRRRQLEADHAAHVTSPNALTPPLAAAGAAAPAEPVSEHDERPPKVAAVCYRQVGALAELSDGEIREVDPDSAARPNGVEAYHLKFRQVTEPRDVFLYPPTGIGEPAPAGHDADPLLANTAESFRNLPWLPQVDLVRFVEENGRQEWLGWNPQHGAWEAWDDPRADYPGSPQDVLDPAGFSDPAPVVIQDLTIRAETVEIDDQLESSPDTWVDYGPDSPDVLSVTDYAPPMSEL
jgi:DNA-binding Xre family transcriptional regulator